MANDMIGNAIGFLGILILAASWDLDGRNDNALRLLCSQCDLSCLLGRAALLLNLLALLFPLILLLYQRSGVLLQCARIERLEQVREDHHTDAREFLAPQGVEAGTNAWDVGAPPHTELGEERARDHLLIVRAHLRIPAVEVVAGAVDDAADAEEIESVVDRKRLLDQFLAAGNAGSEDVRIGAERGIVVIRHVHAEALVGIFLQLRTSVELTRLAGRSGQTIRAAADEARGGMVRSGLGKAV